MARRFAAIVLSSVLLFSSLTAVSSLAGIQPVQASSHVVHLPALVRWVRMPNTSIWTVFFGDLRHTRSVECGLTQPKDWGVYPELSGATWYSWIRVTCAAADWFVGGVSVAPCNLVQAWLMQHPSFNKAGRCAPSPHPAAQSQPAAPTTMQTKLSLAQVAQVLGFAVDNRYWSFQAPNGFIYRGGPSLRFCGISGLEILTPGYPKQPGLPIGVCESTVGASIYVIGTVSVTVTQQAPPSSPGAPGNLPANCMLGSQLAAKMGWPVVGTPNSVTEFGGAVVSVPQGAQLPSGWEFIGPSGQAFSDGGVRSIYPPHLGNCRALLHVSN